MKSSYQALPVYRRGFTLIELLVTLAVFGIMVALAAPRMAGMINRSSLDGAVGQFTSDVAYARMVAIRAAQPVEVVIEATRYTIRRPDNAQQIKRVELAREYPGMTLATGGTLPATMRFNSRGLLEVETPWTITMQRQSRSASVQVLPTGRAYRDY